MKIKKKVIGIVVVLVVVATCFISLGVYYNYLSKPKYVYTVLIDNMSNLFQSYFDHIDKYEYSDNVTIDGDISFSLNSEDFLINSNNNPEALENLHIIENLSKMNTHFTYQKNKDLEKLFLSVLGKIDSEPIINYKYMIDDATEYYYVPSVLNSYVNNGNNNYFEMFNKDNTTKENQEYLYNFLIQSLKNNIDDSSIKITKDVYKRKNVSKASFKVTDSVINDLLKSVLKDMQNDSKANQIISSVYPDFSKTKISKNTTFLNSDESYTINIYSSGIWNSIVKWEIIYLNDNERNTFTYEVDKDGGNAYYLENEKVIYQMSFLIKDNSLDIKINDSSLNNLGDVRLERIDDTVNMNFSYENNNKKYDFLYSSTYKNVKKDSYHNEKKLSFKIINNKVSLLNGSVSMMVNVSNKAKIDNDFDKVVLTSTLNQEVKDSFHNYHNSIIERLKR